jgi:hypothetical protein
MANGCSRLAGVHKVSDECNRGVVEPQRVPIDCAAWAAATRRRPRPMHWLPARRPERCQRPQGRGCGLGSRAMTADRFGLRPLAAHRVVALPRVVPLCRVTGFRPGSTDLRCVEPSGALGGHSRRVHHQVLSPPWLVFPLHDRRPRRLRQPFDIRRASLDTAPMLGFIRADNLYFMLCSMRSTRRYGALVCSARMLAIVDLPVAGRPPKTTSTGRIGTPSRAPTPPQSLELRTSCR